MERKLWDVCEPVRQQHGRPHHSQYKLAPFLGSVRVEDRISAARPPRGHLPVCEPGRLPCQPHLRAHGAAYDCARGNTNVRLTTSSISHTLSPATRSWRGSRCARVIRRCSLRVGWSSLRRFAPCVALRCTTPSRVSAVQSKGIICSTGRAGAVRTLHETLPIGARAASCATAGDRSQAPAITAPVGCTTRSSCVT